MNRNLVIFIPSIEDGGVEKNLYIVSNYLAQKKIKVKIITCNHDKKKNFDPKIDIIGPNNIFWFNQSRKIKYIVSLLYLFFYLIFNRSRKIVFAFQANIYAILVSKLTFTKVITRSNSAPSGWSKNYIKKIFYKLLISIADDVMVNSIEFKKEFKKNFNINAKCILNPFDKSLYKKIIQRRSNQKNLNILTIGRLTDQKDQITLLKAVKFINPKLNPKIQIIGKGKNYNFLRNYINNNKLNKFVEMVGYHSNPSSFFRKTNIFVLTSKYEGLPNVLLEAQFFKKYIISTNCPTGPKEILLNGRAGDLVKIGDYKMLSRLINNYSKRKKIISKMIKTGTVNFERFNYKKNCEKYLSFVKSHF